MPNTSYPNVSITSTNTTLQAIHNGATITSTYGSSVSLTYTAALPADFTCKVIQYDAGAVWVIADTGATVNSTGGAVATSAQYGAFWIMGVTDGNCILTGNLA